MVRKLPTMSKKKIIKFLRSSVTIPMFAIVPFTGIVSIPNPAVVISQNIIEKSSVITTQEESIRNEKAAKVDALLASYKSPLEGYGMKFVTEAEKNGIDYRLLVAIAGRETTFARPTSMCKNAKAQNNPFGWGSCKIGFSSIDDAIEQLSAHLGGNNDNTDHLYADKTTAQILRKYNSVVKNYPAEVMQIMKLIDKDEPII